MKAASTASSLAAVLLSSMARHCDAQDNSTNATTICSCSPTEITFVISLDQTCDDNDIASNSGIGGSFCFTETDVALPAPPPDATAANATNATASSASTTTEAEEPVRSLQATTATDAVVEVVSAQYLEFDTSGDLTVINQDDTYSAVSLVSGDRMKFASASSYLDVSLPLGDQTSGPALVPGGASLIMYGRTASGTIVRNRFFWTYDTSNCGTDNDPVRVDDEIGWVTVSEVSNAWPAFCPALPDGSPTIPPKTNEPTLTPSMMPVPSPDMSMSMSMSVMPVPAYDGGWGSSWSSSSSHATGGPTVQASQLYLPEDDGAEAHSMIFLSSKGGKLESKTYKQHSKSSKGKSSKGKSSKSKAGKGVDGKTGKPDSDDWWGGGWNSGKVAAYVVARNGAARVASGVGGWGSAAVASLVAGVLLMARQ